MSKFTVRLEDDKFGRVVLTEVSASSTSTAISAAVAAPGVSGDTSTFQGAQVVSQVDVLAVTGTDANGNAVKSPTSLPPLPTV